MPDLASASEQLIQLAGGDAEKAALYAEVLIRQRKEKQFIRYWEPCGDQLLFWEKLKPSHRIWLICGGNGSGKTDLSCFLQTAWLLGKDYFRGEANWKWIEPLPIPDRPVSVRAVGLTKDLLKDPIFEKLTGATDHPAFFPDDGSVVHRNNQDYTVRFKTGSKWQGKSADVDPKTHGGPTIDLDCLDEEVAYGIFLENYQRIRKGGFLLCTATPLDDVGTTSHPWIYDLIQQAEAGDEEVLAVFMSSLNNPHLDEDYKRQQIARWKGHPEEQARLYGRPVRRSGLYYPDWRSAPPLWVPATEFQQDAYRVVSVDPAATGPAAAVWMNFNVRGDMTIYRTYKDKGKTAAEHVSAILAENRGEPIDRWICDPWRGRQKREGDLKTVLQVWREAGLPRLQLADVDYDVCLEESRMYIRAAFDTSDPHPRVTVFDHCTEFKQEIENYILDSVLQGPNKGTPRDKPRKGNDDVMNAFQFACGLRIRGVRNRITLVDAQYRSAS